MIDMNLRTASSERHITAAATAVVAEVAEGWAERATQKLCEKKSGEKNVHAL